MSNKEAVIVAKYTDVFLILIYGFAANKYLFKVNNRNTREREICAKLTMKIPERRRHRFGVFIVNFEHVSHFLLMFKLLNLNR